MTDSEKGPFEVEDPNQTGISGVYERLLRTHQTLIHSLTLIPVYMLATLILATALTPALFVFRFFSNLAWSDSAIGLLFPSGIGIAAGFFTYGFSLILIVPLINLMIRPFVKPARGQNYSNRFIAWYLHNALTYLVRYTFLDFITPTPFNRIYFKLMGMKIGKAVQINSSNISDPALITLEEHVTIGGSAVLVAHYGMSGYLILAPITLRKGVTLGLHSKVLGGVEMGEYSKLLPNSVALPKTKIPAGETWGGVPARKIETH